MTGAGTTGLLLRLAVGSGRTALTRLSLVVLASTLGSALLLVGAGIATLSVPTGGGGFGGITTAYLQEPELRRGVVIGIVLSTVPLVLLLAAASRVATRQREQRLAGLRLAGADGRQVRLVAAIDTAVGTAAGCVLGVLLLLLGRQAVLGAADPFSQVAAVADEVLPAPLVAVAVLLAFVVGSAALSALSLRALLITPLGVARRQPRRRPRPYGLALLVLGLLAFTATSLVFRDVGSGAEDLAFGLSLLACLVGLVTAGPWTASLTGRLLAGTAQGPAALLAGRRLQDDPRGQSRASTSVVMVVLVATMALVTYAQLGTDGVGQGDDFYVRGYRAAAAAMLLSLVVGAAGLLVATLEGLVERRRSLAALHACGVDRGVLARSVLLQVVVPVLPQALLAVATGTALVTGLGGAGIPVPYGQLLLLLLGAVALVAAITALTLPALRRHTSLEALRTS